MKQSVKKLYVRMLGNTNNPSRFINMSLDEMEKQCIRTLAVFDPTSSYILDASFKPNARSSVYDDEREILRLIMRYRADG